MTNPAHHTPRGRHDGSRSHRGVLLLVVLSMLTLFMLLGTAYLVLASRTRSTSRAFLKLADDQARSSVTLKPLLRDAALQVIRGTGPSSPIRHHDLLADKYGAPAVQFSVEPGGTIVVPTATMPLVKMLVASDEGLKLCGRVLTFGDGPAAIEGTSCRIVEAEPDVMNGGRSWVYVLQPAGWANTPTITKVWINPREFAGDGFSKTVATPGPGQTALSNAALHPNRSLDGTWLSDDGTAPFSASDANEDYDAVDEQNWALGMANGSRQSFVRREVLQRWIDDAKAQSQPISEQELIAMARLGVAGNASPNEDVRKALINLRRATLRPFAFDHYQDAVSSQTATFDFTGKSLSGSLVDVLCGGKGDVDNDGDGVLDSVWLDLGSSPIRFTDGKQVKPLFAIHCIDLGGRVNINAHGSSAHVLPAATAFPELAKTRKSDGTVDGSTPSLTWGLGFGPADVQLDAVIASTSQSDMLLGSTKASGAGDGIRRDIGGIVGRYGDKIGSVSDLPSPGRPLEIDRPDGGLPGLPLPRQGSTKPPDYWQPNLPASQLGRFGTPPDYWARLAVGIDHRGHPFWANRGDSLVEGIDNPYELDLFAPRLSNGYVQPAGSPDAWIDEPFTAAELEAILRPFDIDSAAALPPRALAVTLSAAGNALQQNRLLATTASWTTPAVVVKNPFEGSADADPDLARGLKMDLNRPFGDGADNDGNGVVDEPGEAGDPYDASPEQLARDENWPAEFLALGQPGPNSAILRARQCLAYHLFTIVDTLYGTFAPGDAADPGLRLFAVDSDQDAASFTPVAVDPALKADPSIRPADIAKVAAQRDHNRRVLAQWAINVVDFLDADAIMTPLRWKSGTGAHSVVWGCEYPDLMITETLAFHDRRTADTKNDPTQRTTAEFRAEYQRAYDRWSADPTRNPYPNAIDPDGNPNTDDDASFDQVRIPEGSLFLELHATRNPNLPNLPRELYSYESGRWALDLGRIPAGGGRNPVWRLAISKPNGPSNDVFRRLAANPDTEWLSPGTNPAQVADLIDIERYVWFTNSPPTAAGAVPGATVDNTFFAKTAASPKLAPGRHLVVGPRPVTYIGSSQPQGAQTWGVPSPQRISLGGRVDVTGLDAATNPTYSANDTSSPRDRRFGEPLPPPGGFPEVSTAVLAMEPPAGAGWSNARAGVAASGIGLNVSEPLRANYYPCPTHSNPTTGLYDAYGQLDSRTGTSFIDTPCDAASGRPVYDTGMLSGGTKANFCTVFVERLADPTRPYEPDATKPGWNPYVAVDFVPIDLTVFNGESSDRDPSETQGPDRAGGGGELPSRSNTPVSPAPPVAPADVPLPIASSATLAARQTFFHTRQRGFGSDLTGYENDGTLFGIGEVRRNANPFKPIGSLDDIREIPLLRAANAGNGSILPGGKATDPSPYASAQAFFRHELGQGPAGRKTSPALWQGVPFHSLGWVNPSFGRRLGASDGVTASYVGSPDRPFPWIVWNDRPFANPFELVYVPRTAPGRLFTNYRNLDYPFGDDYQPPGTTAGVADRSRYNKADLFGACTPGAHLLPLTSVTDVAAPAAGHARHADTFVRLFEFVRVRSPFNAADTFLGTNLRATDGVPRRFCGPFGRASSYRDPGGININTMVPPDPNDPGKDSSVIWNAVCGTGEAPATPTWKQVVDARTISSGGVSYRKPFRPAYGITANFSTPVVPGGQANTLIPQTWIDGLTAADSSFKLADLFTARSFTLFTDVQRSPVREPLFAAPAIDASKKSWADDGDRNAWFRLESLVRANTHTTVRSEVYAIWVTMGLFEVTSGGATSLQYPDGWRLVREYGSESGNITRHRSFFIFDRSVPVCYEPGVDHNVRDALPVERYIE